VARWPDRLTGEKVSVEHWVVAERQGQIAARNTLGAREKFGSAPRVRVEIDGSLAAKDWRLTYWLGGRKLAVLTIGRDHDSLAAEIELEKLIAAET
jgi:hypothetical protein